jgi:hypothetical protein
MGPRGDQGLGNRNNMNRGPRINQQRLQKQDSGRGVPGRNSFNEDGKKMFVTKIKRGIVLIVFVFR